MKKRNRGRSRSEKGVTRHERRGRPDRERRKHRGGNQGPMTFKASVDKNWKGFAFLIPDGKKKEAEDIFLPPREAAQFFHGDRVEVTLGPSRRVSGIRLIEHRFKEVVGRFTPHPQRRGQAGWIVYERKKTREEIFVPKVDSHLRAGEWVRARLHFHTKGPFPVTGEILDTYGPILPPSADVPMIAAEFGVVEDHPATAVEEARKMSLEGLDPNPNRQDLTRLPWMTIDGETARDFDDAIFVESHKSGFILWVGIADVSAYVREGTALDKEARSRGTSVYFPERAFHMLPSALSEDLCSLKPNVPRLALVAKMVFDREGKRLSTDLMEAVIESKRRATYNQIEAEWKQNQKNLQWEYSAYFSLYTALRKMRTRRGSIDFELGEAEVLVSPTGEVQSIKSRARLDAHRLIEEFMIAANEAATEWMMERNWPFVYRIHEVPSVQALEKFQNLAATVGVRVKFDSATSPKTMADLVRHLEGHPAQALLNMALLRSMKQAVYSATHGIHFGLASQAYTHFTSPIRRYPDLVVHRLIRMVLQRDPSHRTIKEAARDKLEKELASVSEHCSYRERLAADAEREANKVKQVRLMQAHLGEEYDGQVIGMANVGLFIQISDPYVEGMVTAESMTDDIYEFDEDHMVFYGRRKKRTFKIGNQVKIRVVRTDLDRRQIDFAII